ncbi:hypothetical protein AXG93_2609s1000 [Marchantia polymorpha subsp. ruderalis]|uniref:Major facilitator superfamily (MFS) profile domain-containing protein n=1 Tax=Marchantia polymorpha subsp. ruderalis TaxID=1480154 RepID=A0A176VSG4_MARPO|nr:hypothetical protein AXG93_2609s1000 [Marchantia polymorpha subsp. ruderalis]
MALGAFAMATLQTTTPLWLVVLVMLAFGTAAIGWNGVYLAEVARAAPPGAAGAATGGTLGFTFLANVLAPIGIGLIAQYFGGLRTAYALLSVPLLIACALFVRLKVASSSQLPMHKNSFFNVRTGYDGAILQQKRRSLEHLQ